MIDQYNRKIEYLRLSVTDRCNLRCQYCMPENGVEKFQHKDILTFEEILIIVESLVRLGIRKVRITGGEPLLRKNIVNLISQIKNIDGIEQVMMTTNGVLLPKMFDELISAGLDGVNLSLDALNEHTFNKITRRSSFAEVMSALNKVLNSNLKVKINCVPILGVNDDDIIKIAELAKCNDIKVRFIELMPIGCAEKCKGKSINEVKALIEKNYGPLNSIAKSDSLQGPAQYFKLNDFKGQIGFIDALEHKYCNNCNRIRLTARGFLRPCLGSNMCFDLKKFTRSFQNSHLLTETLYDIIFQKPREHHFKETTTMMYQLGG